MNSLTLVFFHLLLATAFKLINAAGSPGCTSPVENPNNNEIWKLMSSTLSQHNSGYTITNVKNCKTQVVAGKKYNCEVDIKSPSGVPATCRLVVVQKPWDKYEKVQVVEETCSSVYRTKREVCDGCPFEQDANSSEMKKKLTGILSQTNPGLSLVKGIECTSQIVDGVKYECTIEVESPKIDGVQTCKLAFFEQLWLYPEPEVIEDTCSQLVRKKREVCLGCPVEQDANSLEMKKKLKGILSRVNPDFSLVKGIECTSAIANGVIYNCTIEVESPKIDGVQTCKLAFIEQVWLNPEPEVIEDTCSKLVRNKREVCAGCPVEQDANSSEMKKKLKGILSRVNPDFSLVKGIKCTSQVVAGVKYECTIEVESPKIDGVQTCKLAFVEQVWLNPEPEVIEDTCSQLVRKKREVCAGCPVEQIPNDPEIEKNFTKTSSQINSGLGLVNVEKCTTQALPGGYTPVKTSDDDVQKAASFAEKRINQMINSMYIKRIVDIEQARKQIVAGTNYDLTLRLEDTNCKENQPYNNIKNCEFLTNSTVNMICHVVVCDDLSDVMHLSKINCSDVPNTPSSAARNKRALPGGYTPVKTSDEMMFRKLLTLLKGELTNY